MLELYILYVATMAIGQLHDSNFGIDTAGYHEKAWYASTSISVCYKLNHKHPSI